MTSVDRLLPFRLPHRFVTLMAGVILTSCGSQDRIGGVQRIPFNADRAVAAQTPVLEHVVRNRPLPTTTWVWGAETMPDTDLQLMVTLDGTRVTIPAVVLCGIADIDLASIRGYHDHASTFLSFRGGDAGGAFNCNLEIQGRTTRRYLESGEMTDQSCEYRVFIGGESYEMDTHSDSQLDQ